VISPAGPYKLPVVLIALELTDRFLKFSVSTVLWDDTSLYAFCFNIVIIAIGGFYALMKWKRRCLCLNVPSNCLAAIAIDRKIRNFRSGSFQRNKFTLCLPREFCFGSRLVAVADKPLEPGTWIGFRCESLSLLRISRETFFWSLSKPTN